MSEDKIIDLDAQRKEKLIENIRNCDSLHDNCDFLLDHSDCDDLIEYIDELKEALENKRICYYNNKAYDIKILLNKNNILIEFEKWLEEETKRKNSRWEQFRNQINTQELVLERLNAQIIFIDCCLNKLQELESGKE